MPAPFPEGKERYPFKSRVNYAEREQLREAIASHPSIETLGELLTALFYGEDIKIPVINPKLPTHDVIIQPFLESEVRSDMEAAAQEKNLTFASFVYFTYFGKVRIRKNAAKSKSAGHNVVTYRLGEEALADTERAVELVYGPNVTRHQAMRDVGESWVAATLGKETDNGVIQVHVDADRFEVLKYGALLKYGTEVSLHEAIADIALEAMTAVIENHAEKLADNTIKDS
jgi:hypothetical protein